MFQNLKCILFCTCTVYQFIKFVPKIYFPSLLAYKNLKLCSKIPTFVRLHISRFLHSITSRNMQHAFSHLLKTFLTSNASVENFVVSRMSRFGVIDKVRTFVWIKRAFRTFIFVLDSRKVHYVNWTIFMASLGRWFACAFGWFSSLLCIFVLCNWWFRWRGGSICMFGRASNSAWTPDFNWKCMYPFD